MPGLFHDLLEKSNYFMPHGHCYLWIPGVLWMHVVSDFLIGVAYVGISFILYLLVKRIRLPFSPVFIAFGLFIGLCGITHFMSIWTVWNPNYIFDGLIKAATAVASVATAIGLFFIRPQVEEVVHTARLSEERRIKLESTHAELETLYQKIKQLDELKTRFFANVSHELRTPLALILGPAERMLGDGNLTSEQRRQIESISRNSKVLLKQVNDLLDVAKLEAGKIKPEYVQIDLAPWFKRIASQFDVVAEQRHIRYRIAAPTALHAEVDPGMLERILINLLSNAFKFTSADGTIDVHLGESDDALSISVTDTGPGIDTDQQGLIFERFRQADNNAARAHGGTGLGLAIVKEFVELHGGRIELISAPSQGSTFTVHLPRHPPTSVLVRTYDGAESVSRAATIEGALDELHRQQIASDSEPVYAMRTDWPTALVVEDNPEMRAFIAESLNDFCNVVTAADGQEGVDRVLALHPDVIVTDIMMPRMSGDQLVSAIRSRIELMNVPIILLSAKADDDLRVKLLQVGAQDYLVKPFMPQELRARVGNLIAMKRAGDTLRKELASTSNDVESLAAALAAEHRQLQLALEVAEVAREHAKQASLVKSQFLGLISHELRTPLSTIQMNAQILSSQETLEKSDVSVARIRRVLRASRQMSSLVEGILEYTRAESGRIAVHYETVDLAEVAQEILANHSDGLSPSITLSLEAPAQGLAPLTTDPRLLRVVINNLVANALKFTTQGRVTIRLTNDGSRHRVEVIDTGIGIPPEDLSRIFLPFEQLEPLERKSIPGIGLGLALVKEIVERLHGSIGVTSQSHAGSTFSVTLPSRPIQGNQEDVIGATA